MTSEKGSSAYPEKQSGLFPSANQKQLGDGSCPSEAQGRSMSDYYQNATQKGKLILPKALWILIVVAGLCFLALLSSLNKTINTLDTLVEIEQNNARLNSEQRAADKQAARHEALHGLHADGGGDESASGRHSGGAKSSHVSPSSWLSMPGWTSLEPARSGRAHGRQDSELVRGSLLPLGGSVSIIESSSLPFFGPKRRIHSDDEQESAESLVNSILGSFLHPMLAGQADDNGNNKAPAKKDHPKRRQPETSFTANIDKLNININSAPEEAKSDEANRIREKLHKSRPLTDDRNQLEREDKLAEMGSLDKSIDDLMGKLAESMGEQAPPAPFGLHLGPMAPFRSIERLLEQQQPHHGKQHHQQDADAKPFGLHDLPITHLFGEPLALADEQIGSIPPMFGRPRTTQFVIALDGADEPRPSMMPHQSRLPVLEAGPFIEVKPHRPEAPGQHHNHHRHQNPHHHGQNKPAGSFHPSSHNQHESPYELIPLFSAQLGPLANSPPPMMPFVLPEELANSLTKSIIQQEENPESESIVFINGAPLISDKKQSLPMEENTKQSALDRNQALDLFQLFFGPPPNSKLVVQPQVVGPTITPTGGPASATVAPKEAPKGGANKKHSDESLVEKLVESTVKPEAKQEPQTKTSQTSTTLSPAAQEALKDAEHVVNDLLGSMFTLPQFGSDQGAPVRVANSSPTSSSSSSAASPASQATEITSATPLPIKTNSLPKESAQVKVSDETLSGSKPDIEIVKAELPEASSFASSRPFLPAFELKPGHLVGHKAKTSGLDLDDGVAKTHGSLESSTSRQPEAKLEPSTLLSLSTIVSPPSKMLSSAVTKEESSKPTADVAEKETSNQKMNDKSASSTTVAQKSSPNPTSSDSAPTDKPFKNFLQKADDFLERNIFNLRRFIN